MLAVERRACIKETIQEQKSVAVSDLARRFDVTEETIRRDLKVLEAQGVLTRTYGGRLHPGRRHQRGGCDSAGDLLCGRQAADRRPSVCS